MNRNWLLTAVGLATWLIAPLSARALDFTLSTTTVEEDGAVREVSSFAYDAATTVAIQAPATWKMLTTPATLTMVSSKLPGSEVRLEKSPFAPSAPFKEPDLARYREHALAQAPAGSTEVRLVGETEDALPIFDWTSREYILEYALYGQNYKRGVLFLNVDAKTQLRVTVLTSPADFDRVRKSAFRLLQSWRPSTSASPPRR